MILHFDVVWCQGCGVEITWSPYILDHRIYCCEYCARGLECHCSERMELDDDYQSRLTEQFLPLPNVY